MTKIVRASLGLPTLRSGPQFQNSKPVLVIGIWNLFVIWCLGFVIWKTGARTFGPETLEYFNAPCLVPCALCLVPCTFHKLCIRFRQRMVASRAQFMQRVTTSPSLFMKAMATSVFFHCSGSSSVAVAQIGILVTIIWSSLIQVEQR